MLISVFVSVSACLPTHSVSFALTLLRPMQELCDVQVSHLIFYVFFSQHFAMSDIFFFFQMRAQLFLSAEKKRVKVLSLRNA